MQTAHGGGSPEAEPAAAKDHSRIFAIHCVLDLNCSGLGASGDVTDPSCDRSTHRRMIRVRPVELALLAVLTETNADVEVALDALARVVAVTLAESGDYAAARRFYQLLEAALMREG